MNLRTTSVLVAYLFLNILFVNAGQGEETKSSTYWYRLEVQTGDSTYQCMGRSKFEEKDLAKQLTGTDYIFLEDVTYLDPGTGKAKRWQEWDPRALPRLYVNPRYVIFFTPMSGDPKKTLPPKSVPAK